MNADQINGGARNFLMLLASLISTYDYLFNEKLSHIAALLLALISLVWSLCDPGSQNIKGTIIRRAIQAVVPIMAALHWLTPDDAASLTAFAFVVVAAYDGYEKRGEEK
jgi:hypothetical protein